jgi:NitT/TauT family transport system permease protein
MNSKLRTVLRESRLSGVLLIGLLPLVWQLSAMYVVKSPTWPTVVRILEAWLENIVDGTLATRLLATFWRQMLGYGLAVVLGIGLGLAMGYYRPLYICSSHSWSAAADPGARLSAAAGPFSSASAMK